jgi:hypothetical protein
VDFGSPAANAAAISGFVALVVGVLSAVVTTILADRRANLDQRLADLKGQFDRSLADRRASVDQQLASLKGDLDKEIIFQKAYLDDRTTYAAERVAHKLLMNPRWQWRSFETIQHFLGGFEENELRKILVRAGAIRATGKDGVELWGLIDRNEDHEESTVNVDVSSCRPVEWKGWSGSRKPKK